MATTRTPVSKKTTTKKAAPTAKPPASTAKPAPKARTKSASVAIAKPASPKQKKLTLDTAATSKPRAAKKSPAKKIVTPEERYQMIAAAAYFLAERHGFTSGRALDDWIAAEQEIDSMLKSAD
jgi:hypothetical protein